ncbi:hypothetical protein WR25_20346 [Diploscapter pachys]|uniref:Uncharacterized protein n=1 Tax=Diploscapter pachys TaxID=2018661 RepID=A0A2A2K874_9BILA|nr:hypothetical protein WR25_20346 [Diploscapter pachys]
MPPSEMSDRSVLFEAIEQIRLADHVQVALVVHCHSLGPGNGVSQAIEPAQQGHEADLLTFFVKLEQHVGVCRQCQQMPRARVDTQRGQVAQVQFVAGQRLLLALQRATAISAPSEHFGRTLGADDQALAHQVPGNGFKALVALIRFTQVMGLVVGTVQRGGGGIHLDQRQGELDQERVLSHDCEQRPGVRVERQVRRLVTLHTRQRLGIDVDHVAGQPDAFLAFSLAFETFLYPQQAAVVPVHGRDDAIADNRCCCQAERPAPVERALGGHGGAGRKGHARVLRERREPVGQSTRLSNRLTPGSSSTSSSPTSNGPTPAGVPVRITSPACNEKHAAICWIIGTMGLSIIALLPSWRTSPLMVRRMPMSFTSSKAPAETNGGSTQAPSKLLHSSHGRPFSFSLLCRSRRVRSKAGA